MAGFWAKTGTTISQALTLKYAFASVKSRDTREKGPKGNISNYLLPDVPIQIITHDGGFT